MKKVIKRDMALDILTFNDLIKLDESDRENILIELNIENDKFKDINSSDFNKEISEFLKLNYQGVKNEYLSNKINEIFKIEVNIIGDVEDLDACPCCNYKTLSVRGQYDICRVCFWEDDSIKKELSRYSSVNRMTLKKGKDNFNKIGAISEKYIKFIDTETKIKYYM